MKNNTNDKSTKQNNAPKWKQILLPVLILAFLLSGIKIFDMKIEENKGADAPVQDVTEKNDETADETAEQKEDQTADAQNTSDDGSQETGVTPSGKNPVITVEPGVTGESEMADIPEGYFQDALFIGDSRTVGLMEYGQIPGAAFFANTGMSVYHIHDDQISLAGGGKATFSQFIRSGHYGKIYVMLGINELGYDMGRTVEKFGSLIQEIRECQPDAIIYIEANLHVTEARSAKDAVFNNTNIDLFNQQIAQLADGEKIFYVDINPMFDDGKGNLAEQYTNDATHVLGKYYQVWAKWLANGGNPFR